MKVDFQSVFGLYHPNKLKIVANLPYYVSSPVIIKLLEFYNNISIMVLMVQKEVAQRIVSSPGNKIYGSLSVAVQMYAHPRTLFNVPSTCFIPRPDVDSTVIQLNISKEISSELLSNKMFYNILRASFSKRRKTLLNSLYCAGLLESKEAIRDTLINIGIDPLRRAETLSIPEFITLSNGFYKL